MDKAKRTGRPRANKFSLMSTEEMMHYLWDRYQLYGIGSLSYISIKKEKGLYFHLYKKELKIKDIVKEFGLEKEYASFKKEHFSRTINGKVHHRWSWKRIIDETQAIVDELGFLPPAQWFQTNGKATLVAALYYMDKTWNDLRAHFNCYENSDFVESRNGMRWRSHPEASLSNYLYARGIEHKPGEKYPKEYGKQSDQSYGYYDLHFKSSNNMWIDVEIWGDKPKGHQEHLYRKKRTQKEEFNKTNPYFLGLHYSDCYEDSKLDALLVSYIGQVEPYIFDKPTDKILQPTHWSNADELIEFCKQIAKQQSDGIFPTEDWLRKRGKFKDREGPTYNTVSIYIKKWIGGVRKLREILGQEEYSTTTWTKEKAIAEYRAWFDNYGFTPGQARTSGRNLSNEEVKLANNISHAVAKYSGSVEQINTLLNIEPIKTSKWNKEKILDEFSRIFERYSLTPTQIANLSENDRKLFAVNHSDIAISKQLIDRVSSYFSGLKEVYTELGIQKTDMRILRKKT